MREAAAGTHALPVTGNNLKVLYKTLFLCCCLLCAADVSSRADDEDTREKHKDINQIPPKTAPKSALSIRDKLSYNVYVGVFEGYDNNVYLDSKRKGDLFDQFNSDAVLRYRINDNFDVKARYDFTGITYHEFTDVSMMDNRLAASFEYYHQDRVKTEAGYSVDFIDYFKGKDSDLASNGPFAGIRYYIDRKTYIGGIYQYTVYDYKSRKIRDGLDNEIDSTRKDCRNTVITEFAAYVDNLFVKVKNTYFINDSNDEYLDYYDYNSERVNLYVAYPVSARLTVLINGGYQRKDFKSRTTIKDPDKKEQDNIIMLGGGLFYQLSPSCSANLDYSYRQNYSNDPIQEYSGSIMTAGINISF